MSLTYFARNARSADRARRRMQREGVTMSGAKLWTDEEREIVRNLAPDYDAILKQLPHRTRNAVRNQAGKMGLRRAIHIWTAAEISRLRKLFPRAPAEEICAAFPHSTWINIQQAARYHGLRRSAKQYKITGIDALDEVRKRCFEINWTMIDLDNAAKTKRYFRRAGWIGKKINHRALGRAIEALDGVVQAQWNE